MINKEDIHDYVLDKQSYGLDVSDILDIIKIGHYKGLTYGNMKSIGREIVYLNKEAKEIEGITKEDEESFKEGYLNNVVKRLVEVYLNTGDNNKNKFPSKTQELDMNEVVGDYLDFSLRHRSNFRGYPQGSTREQYLEEEVYILKTECAKEARRQGINLYQVNKKLRYLEDTLGMFVPEWGR